MLTTSCHCGAIRLEFARRPRKLTQCNCSMCRRYGAIWAYYRRKSVRVVCPRNALSVYAWGYKRRQFYRCRNCGSVTHYESARKRTDGSDWLAINVRNIDDPESIARLPIKMLDGAATWKVLGEHIQPDLFRSPAAKSKKAVRDPKRSRGSRRAV
jgi:hypothetical protein